MELRSVEDLFFDALDDCAVDSKFFDAVLNQQAADFSFRHEDQPPRTEESSCSSAPSFASGQSGASESCSLPLAEGDVTDTQTDEGTQILASHPLLQKFLEIGRQGLSRCLFFRSSSSPFFVVAQSMATIANRRRFYDNLNMLEGLGMLKRGPISSIDGKRHRLFTWYGDSFMVEDFRRLLRHGEKTGLVAAVRAVEEGRTPAVDSFTAAVNIARQETHACALERRRPRGKCPLNVGIQRVLVVLLAASRPVSIEAITFLLQLPYTDVNLQRRYFYIRDVLVTFGLARISKLGELKHSFFEYCGPPLVATPPLPRVVPLFLLKENVLTPLRIQLADSPLRKELTLPAPEPFSAAEIPASLLDAREVAENLPPCAEVGEEEEEDAEEDLLMRTFSNASSVLRRTDTMLPWTNSS